MTTTDIRGHQLTGATPTALRHYETALRQFALYVGDPVASVDQAIAASPDFVMAHAFRAWLHLLGTEPAGLPVAREALAAVKALPATTQEQGHLTAIGHLIAGRWQAASQTLEDVTVASPRDLLALQAGHVIDFFRGDARMLRDRIARALPAWSKGVPGHHAVLGMQAFGLEESGDYAAAEKSGRKAVELERRDSWAQHAVAHVMEMQGRQKDGIRWMENNTEGWSKDNFFAVHNWWHLALYYLDLGETERVLDLFDGPIYGARSKVVLDMIDASAMLWRLHLRGIDVGARWDWVADAWEPIADAGNYAFNDVHAMMAFVGAGRSEAIRKVFAAQAEAMNGAGDNASFTREVGHPVAKAIKAFGDADYDEVVRLLRPVRNIAHRFGGSHAQRDVLDLTLIEAAMRANRQALAAALAAERAAMRPTSPLARLFVQRATRLAA
ncbi:MAG: tetratricopeptide repeat protein [Xanthobacteraceae bacterium]|nr:tetratricopeptide repeat protein [Burkholderiales bacterium]MCZ7658721.1 tetratricopeptide repeat protein [Xanthobacteraceae bacterium]